MAGRRWSGGLVVAVAMLAAAAVAAGPDPARAEEPAKAGTDAAEAVAKSALEKFEQDFQKPSVPLRVEAVRALGKTIHPTVASKLFEVGVAAAKDPDDAKIGTYAFRALATQKSSHAALGPKVAKFLTQSAEENRKRKAKGDYGVRVDPKTGAADETTEEGKTALRRKRDRATMLAEAMKVLDATGQRGKDDVETLAEFLADGNDDLVVSSLAMLARWKAWGALPEMLDLYELYPTEDRVDVGSTAVDTGAAGSADQQAAKRAWFAKYGDPDRRRARPPVVRALRQALTDITGQTFETPRDLREFLRKPDVERKVKAK